jgi:hypothetical protein
MEHRTKRGDIDGKAELETLCGDVHYSCTYLAFGIRRAAHLS